MNWSSIKIWSFWISKYSSGYNRHFSAGSARFFHESHVSFVTERHYDTQMIFFNMFFIDPARAILWEKHENAIKLTLSLVWWLHRLIDQHMPSAVQNTMYTCRIRLDGSQCCWSDQQLQSERASPKFDSCDIWRFDPDSTVTPDTSNRYIWMRRFNLSSLVRRAVHGKRENTQ